jgi:hypothetical protein
VAENHAYWRDLIARVSDPETTILVGYTTQRGTLELFRGRIVEIEASGGPLVEVDVSGCPSTAPLCSWTNLRFVECLTPAEAVAERLDAEYRAVGLVPPQRADREEG